MVLFTLHSREICRSSSAMVALMRVGRMEIKGAAMRADEGLQILRETRAGQTSQVGLRHVARESGSRADSRLQKVDEVDLECGLSIDASLRGRGDNGCPRSLFCAS